MSTTGSSDNNTLVNVFERITGAGVDFIEVGFLDQRRPFDIDRSIMPSTECMERIYGGLNRHLTEVVGMIDYGTCGLERIQPAAESFLDGIRVIFKNTSSAKRWNSAVVSRSWGTRYSHRPCRSRATTMRSSWS